MFYSGKASSVTCGSSARAPITRQQPPDVFMAQLQLRIPALKREDCPFHQQERFRETQHSHSAGKHCSSETHFSLRSCLPRLGTGIWCSLLLEEFTSLTNQLFCPKGGETELRFLPCPFLRVQPAAALAFLLCIRTQASQGEYKHKEPARTFSLFVSCLPCNEGLKEWEKKGRNEI